MRPTAIVLAATLVAPALVAAQTAVDQRRPLAPDGVVKIELGGGSLKVTGWDRPEVHVTGNVDAQTEISVEGSERKVQIEAENGVNPLAGRSDLEVRVPSGATVDIETFQATISVAGVSGGVDAQTVNGSISHSGTTRSAKLQSVSGPIETTKAGGRTAIEAVNGPVTVREASGELDVETVNGSLTISGGSFDRVQLEAVAGSVRFSGGLTPKGTLSVETVSGSVDLQLPAALGAEFAVSSFSGAITNELGPAAEKADPFTPGKELRFTNGAGGARVSVETLSGAVHIRKR